MSEFVKTVGRFVTLQKISGNMSLNNQAFQGKARYNLEANSIFRVDTGYAFFVTSTVESYKKISDTEYHITTQNSVYALTIIPIDLYATYRHHSGNEYVVTDICNVSSDDLVKFPVTVVYQSTEDRRVWCRPLQEFIHKFTKISD